MALICGVDPAQSSGYAVHDTNSGLWLRWGLVLACPLAGLYPPAREALDGCQGLAEAVIEDQWVSAGNVHIGLAVARASGVWEAVLVEHGLRARPRYVAPIVWRSALGLPRKGAAIKTAAIELASGLVGETVPSDVADAICLCEYLRRAIEIGLWE